MMVHSLPEAVLQDTTPLLCSVRSRNWEGSDKGRKGGREREESDRGRRGGERGKKVTGEGGGRD